MFYELMLLGRARKWGVPPIYLASEKDLLVRRSRL